MCLEAREESECLCLERKRWFMLHLLMGQRKCDFHASHRKRERMKDLEKYLAVLTALSVSAHSISFESTGCGVTAGVHALLKKKKKEDNGFKRDCIRNLRTVLYVPGALNLSA